MLSRPLTLAWLFFVGLLLLELVVEYSLRTGSDAPYQLALAEPVWFGWQIIAAAIGGFFLARSTRSFVSTGRKLGHLLLNALLAGVVYLLLLYAYVLGQGIAAF